VKHLSRKLKSGIVDRFKSGDAIHTICCDIQYCCLTEITEGQIQNTIREYMRKPWDLEEGKQK